MFKSNGPSEPGFKTDMAGKATPPYRFRQSTGSSPVGWRDNECLENNGTYRRGPEDAEQSSHTRHECGGSHNRRSLGGPGGPLRAAAGVRAPRLADGRPDFNGIWQVLNEANYDIEAHMARPAMALRAGPHYRRRQCLLWRRAARASRAWGHRWRGDSVSA